MIPVRARLFAAWTETAAQAPAMLTYGLAPLEISEIEALPYYDVGIHELNNVLQVVSSGVRVVERCIREGRVRDAVAILEQISSAADRANVLIAHGHPASAPRAKRTLVQVGDLLFSLRAPLRWMLGSGSTLRMTAASDIPSVFCVEPELRLALFNLVASAHETMPGGGQVCIDIRRVTKPAEGGRSYVVVRIRDTGHGRADAGAYPAYGRRPDREASLATADLRLTMVAIFARAHGGSATIDSALSQGTMIELSLPCQPSSWSDFSPARAIEGRTW